MRPLFSFIMLATIISQSIVLLIFNTVESYLWKTSQWQEARHLGTENGEFKHFTFTLQEFTNYTVNAKEFVLNGEMYDIKHKEVCDGYINIKAKHDGKEKEWKERNENYLSKNTTDKKNQQQNSPNYYFVYLIPDILILNNYQHNTIQESLFSHHDDYFFDFRDESYLPPEC